MKVLQPDHPKIYLKCQVDCYYWWKKEPKWAKKPPTIRKSTAKLSHIAQVQGRLKPALARGERLRV